MIGVTDVANILYRDCKRFGIETIPFGQKAGDLTKDRITIHPKRRTGEKYWNKGFIEVNFVTPNQKNGIANQIRLNELESMARTLEGYGKFQEDTYRYSVESISIEEDTALRGYFVNTRLIFEILNVR